MRFTGNNLRLVRAALEGAVSDIRMHIASCPDVFEYAEDLDILDQGITVFEKLLARVDRALTKEIQ